MLPRRLFRQALTLAHQSVALLLYPPVTLVKSALASLYCPPLTLAFSPLAVLAPPPTGTGLCSTSGVVLAPADARRLAIGYIITSSADTGPPVCRLIVGPSTDTRRVALRCITRSPTDTRPWTTDGVAKPHYQTPYTGKSMLRAHDEVVGACTLMRTKILLVIADNEVPKPRRRISFIGVARATANMDIDPFENNVRPTHTIYIAINETDVGKNRL
jgi:hypothetical protein